MTKKQIKFHLPILTENTLRNFVYYSFGVSVPDTQVCPNHSTPWRAFCDAYFARYPVTVWEASRGFGGKSFLLSLLALVEACTLKVDVNVLGGSGEQSARVLAHMGNLWNHSHAPRNLLRSDPSKRETHLVWGNRVQALMASQKSVRGPHAPRLRLDEIDEMDLQILDAAMGQPMTQAGVKPQTVMSSTHQNPDGTMTEILKRAREKNWAVHTWCWKETAQPHGWLTLADIEQKRSDVTEQMWKVEYDLQEPSPESRAIMPAAVERMFLQDLGVYAGTAGELVVTEPYDPNGVYCTGTDWAKEKDWTIIWTLRTDCFPVRFVAFLRIARMAWPAMAKKLDERMRTYGGLSAHDATGIGNVVSDYLTVQSRPVVLAGRIRSDIISDYIAAIENGLIVSPRVEHTYNEHRYVTNNDIYGSGHLPDSVCAGALAWYAARQPVVERQIVYQPEHIGGW